MRCEWRRVAGRGGRGAAGAELSQSHTGLDTSGVSESACRRFAKPRPACLRRRPCLPTPPATRVPRPVLRWRSVAAGSARHSRPDPLPPAAIDLHTAHSSRLVGNTGTGPSLQNSTNPATRTDPPSPHRRVGPGSAPGCGSRRATESRKSEGRSFARPTTESAASGTNSRLPLHPGLRLLN